jgi:hypothetical protein
MILNRILPTILVSCVLSLTAYSQKQEKSDAYLDASESTIYLSFERFGGNDSVWLRLHNNSLWAIEWEQISLRYAYEWESEGYTAQHRVRFQGKDLPTIR